MNIFTKVLPVVLISVLPLSAQDQAAHTLKSAETCKECHEQHYVEWKNSAHAHFSREENLPLVLTVGGQKSRNEKSDRCRTCHEPLRQFSDYVSDSNIIVGERITCDFCHSVQIDHPHDKFKLHPSGAKQGPIENADSPEHSVAYSKEITSSDFCLVCHHMSRKRHRELRTQFPKELINCQNCHMPLRNDGSNEHIHSFPGRYSEEMLQKAVEFNVEVQEAPAGFQVDIKIKNIVNAHSVPPARAYGHIVLMVNARDVNNRIVWKNWKLDTENRSPEPLFASIHADSRGNVPVAIVVKVNESKEFRYMVENKAIRWVEAKLLAYPVTQRRIASKKIKDPFYTKSRTMAFRRLYLGSDN